MDPDATFVKHVQWISVKYDQLEKVHNEGTKMYKDKVQQYMAGAKLLELIELNPEIDRLTGFLNRIADLRGLSEDTIFTEYEAGIQIAGTKKFTGLTKENIEAFYRLKLRSIESRLGQGIIPKLPGLPQAQVKAAVDG